MDAHCARCSQHPLDTDRSQQLHRRDIIAVGQRSTQRHRAVVRAIIVARCINLPRTHRVGDWGIPEHCGRTGQVLRQCRGIENRFDRTARLAQAARHIDLAGNRLIVKIGAADHDEYFAAGGTHGDQGRIAEIIGITQFGDLARDQPLCGLLHRQIERRGNVQPSTAGITLAKACIQGFAEQLHKMGG